MKGRALAFAAVALATPLVACQFLAGIEERYVADAGPDATFHDGLSARDAGRDRARVEDAAPEHSTFCLGAQPPAPPKTTSMTGESGDFYVAVESIWYDPGTDAGRTLGYNLDHTCTCEGKPAGPPSCVNDATPNCDSDAGRDIEGNNLLVMVDQLVSTSVAQLFESKINSGQVTAILKVGNFNRGANDQSVNLTAYVSGGLLLGDGGPEAGLMSPKWDGTDSWSIDPRSTSAQNFVDGGWQYDPLFVDTSAYVTDYTLVARLDSLRLGLGQADLSLSDAVMVARIEPDTTTGGYSLTGQIAGRLSLATIFALASTFTDPTTPDASQDYCGSDTVFQGLIRPMLCRAADIMSAASKDNTGQGCDALSLGIGFTAKKVLLGPPHQGINPVQGCDGSVANCDGL